MGARALHNIGLERMVFATNMVIRVRRECAKSVTETTRLGREVYYGLALRNKIRLSWMWTLENSGHAKFAIPVQAVADAPSALFRDVGDGISLTTLSVVHKLADLLGAAAVMIKIIHN